MSKHIVISLILASVLIGGPAFASGWEKFDQEEGIVSYRKPVAGSSIVAFKGEADIQASIEKVLWVLTDNEHKPKWVHRMKKSYELEAKSPYHKIIYQVF